MYIVDLASGKERCQKMKTISILLPGTRVGLLSPPSVLAAPAADEKFFEERRRLLVNDELLPLSDLRIIADSRRETDRWVMGGDQHRLGQHHPIVIRKVATWLTDRLVDRQNGKF